MKAILCLTTKSCITQCVVESCSATLGSSTGSLYQLSSSGECLFATKETLQQSGRRDSKKTSCSSLLPASLAAGLAALSFLATGDALSGMNMCMLIQTLKPVGLPSPTRTSHGWLQKELEHEGPVLLV